MLTFQPDIVLVGFLEISCRIPSMTFTSHEPNRGELLSKFLVYEFEHITKKGRMCVIMVSLSQLDFIDRRISETPQIVTNKMNIRGLHTAEDHCYLQYSQLYSA
jgi:hypothetical protein